MRLKALALFALALILCATSSLANPPQVRSIVVNGDHALTADDLSCDCTWFVLVADGATATIDLAKSEQITGWTPEVIVTAENSHATFTVISGKRVLALSFTTRSGFYHNQARGAWVRHQ